MFCLCATKQVDFRHQMAALRVFVLVLFFWLGLFLIQSYTTVASPSLKECRILMLENEVEGKVSVCKRLGLRAMA